MRERRRKRDGDWSAPNTSADAAAPTASRLTTRARGQEKNRLIVCLPGNLRAVTAGQTILPNLVQIVVSAEEPNRSVASLIQAMRGQCYHEACQKARHQQGGVVVRGGGEWGSGGGTVRVTLDKDRAAVRFDDLLHRYQPKTRAFYLRVRFQASEGDE